MGGLDFLCSGSQCDIISALLFVFFLLLYFYCPFLLIPVPGLLQLEDSAPL